MDRISPFFSLSHGARWVDVRRVVSGMIYVIRHGLQWRGCSRKPMTRTRPCTIALYVGATAPPTKNRKQVVEYDKTLYHPRHKIKNIFGKLKD